MKNQISLKTTFLLLTFIFIGMNLMAKSKEQTIITWQNPFSVMSVQKIIPLEASATSLELSPINGKMRFEVCVTFKINQTDSLYKRGESFIIAHATSIGSIVDNDSIEFANQNFAILDDNHQQATFTFRVIQRIPNTWYNLIFDGGRYNKSNKTIDASNFKLVENDGSILCFISVMLAEQLDETVVTWQNVSDPTNDIRKVPLKVLCIYSKLPSSDDEKRFEVTVKFTLDPSDSLYKPGEHFVIGHPQIRGTVDRGDSIEFADKDYALLDENQPQAIFTYRLTKSMNSAFHNFFFEGGRIFKDNVNVIPTIYPTESFKTDHSILCIVRKQLLQYNDVINKEHVPPILHRQNPDRFEDTRNNGHF